MLFGPIFPRELLVMARRPVNYRTRAWSGVLLLGILWVIDWIWRAWVPGLFSVQGVAAYARSMAFSLLGLQLVMTFGGVPSMLAPVIAGEKQRKTLHYLLASRLSSTEIVSGKLASRLALLLTSLAVSLPILLTLCLLGGVDWRLVALIEVGLLTMAYFLAALTTLISTWARDSREAIHWSVGLASTWFFAPLLVDRFLASLWPPFTSWLHDANHWLFFPSSPIGPLMTWPSLANGNASVLAERIVEMAAYQLGYGTLMIALAAALLRPLYRRQADGDGGFARAVRRRRARKRPACGDDPILWREVHLSRRSGPWAQLIGSLVVGGMLVALAVADYQFAIRCFTASDPAGLAVARTQFNFFLRGVTCVSGVFILLGLAGLSATAISIEREADTWDSLLTTPLSGREILRGKILGSARRFGAALLFPIPLWTTGLLAGAVHPLGFLLATAGLVAFTAFTVALGVWASLVSKDTSRASSMAGGVFLVVNSALPLVVGFSEWFAGATKYPPLMWSSCMPAVLGGSLLGPNDVSGWSVPLASLSPNPGDWLFSRPALAATWLIGVIGYSAAAAVLARWSATQFDRLVGRPHGGARGKAVEESPAWPLPATELQPAHP